jgi:hypothetical protein
MSSNTLLPPNASHDSSIPDLDFEEMDIHGKLVMLDAVDLQALTLTNRCALILLSGPWCSDDLGRFMGPSGFLPELSALSKRQTSTALRALTEKEMIKTWTIGGVDCWEVAGAFAFKKNLKAAFSENRRIARLKWQMRNERMIRRKEEFKGESYAYENDASPNADGVVEAIRTADGGHVPMRPTMFFKSKVPLPKRIRKYKLIVPQPTNEAGRKLHMYPSFNVYAGLSELGVVLRHRLLWNADDYGRVRIDIPTLHSELGSAITKRVTLKDVGAEIQQMCRSQHLLLFERASGNYAYIRDAAQHLKNRMFRDMKLPKLVDDREFTHDSDAYKSFTETCRALSTRRDKVYLTSYAKAGLIYGIYEYVEAPAKRFLQKYHEIISSDIYAQATVDTIYEISNDANMNRLYQEEMFYYGYLNKMSYEWMDYILRNGGDGMRDPEGRQLKILRYLIGMTPQEYVDKLRRESLIDRPTGGTHQSF